MATLDLCYFLVSVLSSAYLQNITRWSVPRFGNLKGPIDDTGVAHPCFPWRVLGNILSTVANDAEDCLASCPTSEITLGPRRRPISASGSVSLLILMLFWKDSSLSEHVTNA